MQLSLAETVQLDSDRAVGETVLDGGGGGAGWLSR